MVILAEVAEMDFIPAINKVCAKAVKINPSAANWVMVKIPIWISDTHKNGRRKIKATKSW